MIATAKISHSTFIRVSREETENKVLKDSDVCTRSYVIKLAKSDITNNKRRESNIRMERDHVSRTIVISEYPVVRDVANPFSAEGARLFV